MRYVCSIFLLSILSCTHDSFPADHAMSAATCPLSKDSTVVAKRAASPDSLVAFAKTLLGTPYKFGCTAPSTGFDCSGFINYVFNHFDMEVPRSSVDFTNEGRSISLDSARPGDLILFTGTNSNIRTVGHIGLVVANDSLGLSFIHSSSGPENAVIITQLDERYMRRFVKVIRIVK